MDPRRKPQPPVAFRKDFNRELVAELMRIGCHLSIAEARLRSAGLETEDAWLPFDPVFNLILTEVFGTPYLDMATDEVVSAAWMYYPTRFDRPEEIDPQPFVRWLAKGDFRRNPFKRRRAGIWSWWPGLEPRFQTRS